jgi:hypothetical protein
MVLKLSNLGSGSFVVSADCRLSGLLGFIQIETPETRQHNKHMVHKKTHLKMKNIHTRK